MVTTTHSQDVFSVFSALSTTTSHLLSLLQDVGALEGATRQAETEILKEVLRRIQPLIKYLDKKVEVKAAWSNHYAVNDYKSTHLRERAISLVGGRTDGRANADADADTVYAGVELVLTRSGKFLELSYEGRCSQYQSEGGHWEAICRCITPDMVITMYGLNNVVGRLQRVFCEALELLEKRKQNLQKRLEFITNLSLPTD